MKKYAAYYAAALFILLSTLAAYHSVFFNELLFWDTEKFIRTNPYVHELTPANLWWMLTEIYIEHWHPLTWLSHGVDVALYGMDAWGHHLSSLLLHGANALWFGFLLIVLMKIRGAPHALLVGFSAALLFAVHPQHIESVAWEAERKDVLSLFFALPALSAYLFYAYAGRPRARRYWYILSLLCMLGALMGKTMVVTLPAVLLLFDVYPLKRLLLPGMSAYQGFQGDVLYRLLREKLPFFALSLFAVVLTLWGQIGSGTVADLHALDMQTRLLNAAHSLIFYISKFLIPIGLSPHYPFPDYSQTMAWLPSLAAVFLITFSSVYLWFRGRPLWLCAWLFYLITLSPVSGIIQAGAQAAADRYTYLTTLGFYLLLGLGIARLYSMRRSAAWAVLLVLTLVWGGLTWRQTQHWRNELSLWRYAALYYPNACEVQSNLAAEYMRRKEYDKSITHFQRCLAEEPLYLRGYNQMAVVYAMKGDYQGALQAYLHIVRHSPADAVGLETVCFNIAAIYYNYDDLERARQYAECALQRVPDYQKAVDLLEKIRKAETKDHVLFQE